MAIATVTLVHMTQAESGCIVQKHIVTNTIHHGDLSLSDTLRAPSVVPSGISGHLSAANTGTATSTLVVVCALRYTGGLMGLAKGAAHRALVRVLLRSDDTVPQP